MTCNTSHKGIEGFLFKAHFAEYINRLSYTRVIPRIELLCFAINVSRGLRSNVVQAFGVVLVVENES